MEVDEEEHAKSESEKRRRYRFPDLAEAADTELWMEIHYHADMDVDEDVRQQTASTGAQLDLEPQLQDMIRASDLAIRVFERRRQQALDANDLNALDAFERNYPKFPIFLFYGSEKFHENYH